MRSDYPLFQSHLDLAYTYWKQLIEPGDIIIDATCGNGKDTLKLAQLNLTKEKGILYAYDIQKQALESAHLYLSTNLPNEQFLRIQFILGSHAEFSPTINPATVKLVVYNLGYLPGGNKALTTHTTSTLQSLQRAVQLIQPGGAISITCYPGHPEGALEEKAILDFMKTLSPMEWSCCHHRWLNRMHAPSLLLIQKSMSKNASSKTQQLCDSIELNDPLHS